jgi:uncharacterized protein (TIGR02996 family)
MILDTVKLAERLAKSPAAVGKDLGVKLDHAASKKLREMGKLGSYSKEIGVPILLSLLARAARASDEEVIYEKIEMYRATAHVILVRTPGKVAIGAGRSHNYGLGQAFGGELKGWNHKHKSAREKVLKWAKSQLTLELHERAGTAAGGGDEEALLRQAVLDAPDDDAPRLVYADWLIDRGDARGEFIRLQIEQARLPNEHSDRWNELNELIATLWKANRVEMAGELAPYAKAQWHFRRGFVEAVAMTATQFAKDGDRLLRLQPVHHLVLATPRPSATDMRKLANADGMRLVRHLDIHQPSKGRVRELAALASGHKYDRLEQLSLMFCGASAKDWRDLFSDLDAPALRELHLFYNRSSPAMYQAIAGNARLGALRKIDEYAYDPIDAPKRKEASAAVALLAAKPSFEHLEISQWEEIGDAGILPYFAASARASLRVLDLTGAGIGDETALAIARSPKAKTLEILKLWNSFVTVKGMLALLESKQLGALKELRIVAHDDELWPIAHVEKVAEAALALPKGKLAALEIPHQHGLKGDLKKRFKKRFGGDED